MILKALQPSLGPVSKINACSKTGDLVTALGAGVAGGMVGSELIRFLP
jgi:hypothetical protein